MIFFPYTLFLVLNYPLFNHKTNKQSLFQILKDQNFFYPFCFPTLRTTKSGAAFSSEFRLGPETPRWRTEKERRMFGFLVEGSPEKEHEGSEGLLGKRSVGSISVVGSVRSCMSCEFAMMEHWLLGGVCGGVDCGDFVVTAEIVFFIFSDPLILIWRFFFFSLLVFS